MLVLQAVESLAAVADSNMSHTGALARDGCVDSLLSVLVHANAGSRAVRTAAALLQYLAQHQSIVRCSLDRFMSVRVHLCCNASQIARAIPEVHGGTWICRNLRCIFTQETLQSYLVQDSSMPLHLPAVPCERMLARMAACPAADCKRRTW